MRYYTSIELTTANLKVIQLWRHKLSFIYQDLTTITISFETINQAQTEFVNLRRIGDETEKSVLLEGVSNIAYGHLKDGEHTWI